MAKSKTKSRAVEQVSSSSSVSMPPSKPPKPSASSSSSQDLAALEAHFLATFGEGSLPAAGPSRIKEQEKFESEEEDGQRVADVSHSEGGKVKKQSPKAGVKAKAVGPSPSSATPRQPPQTVVFEEMGGRGRSQPEDEVMGSDSRKKWRDFMNSKTANTGPDSMTSASELLRSKVEERRRRENEKKAARAEAGEDEDEDDEAEQLTNDRQLSHLLNTTLFSQGSSSKKRGNGEDGKPDLSSHSTLARILEHSSSSSARKGQAFGRGHGEKTLRASQLAQMPRDMRQGIRSAAEDRAEKEMERNREMGLLNSAYSRKFLGRQEADATMTGKRKQEKDRVRGLGMGVGRFKDGTLRLSRDEVAKMTGEGGGSRGGKGAKGGGGGAKRQKR